MSTLRRYTDKEDKLILAKWWDPKNREALSKEFGRTIASINFRYYSLLKKLDINPAQHRLNKGIIPDGTNHSGKEDIQTSMADKLEEMEDELSGIASNVSKIESMLSTHISSSHETEDNLVTIYNEYRQQLENNRKMYKELDYWLGKFFNLNNMEKVSTLGDFLPRIKNIIESYSKDSIEDEELQQLIK